MKFRKDLVKVLTHPFHIEGKVEGRTSDAAMRDVVAVLTDFPLPSGYRIDYAGEREEHRKRYHKRG